MKIYTKILIIIGLIFSIFIINGYAGTVDLPTNGMEEIKELSNKMSGADSANGDIVEVVKNTGTNILGILKTLLQGILLIYIIYIGIQMTISMGTDDDKLSKGKNQLWYSLIAIMFINIPGTIYTAIHSTSTADISDQKKIIEGGTSFLINGGTGSGTFIGIVNNVVAFIEVIIFGIAIFTIVMHGIKIMSARGRDEKITEAKSKILYSLIAGIFVGFIDAWRNVAMSGNMIEGGVLFGKITDIALLFAGPVAIFFLTLAGYYYITSNGDEEKVKKSKSIIVNTLIGVILLGAMFTFLNDLANF